MATREETKRMIEVMQAYVDGKEVEYKRTPNDAWISWHNISWDWAKFNYRIAETPNEIDWSHVAPGFKWMATDANGVTWLHCVLPEIDTVSWRSYGEQTHADNFTSFKRGTVSWENSLVERPND